MKRRKRWASGKGAILIGMIGVACGGSPRSIPPPPPMPRGLFDPMETSAKPPVNDASTLTIPLSTAPLSLRGAVRLVARPSDGPLVLAVKVEAPDARRDETNELLVDVREEKRLPATFDNRTRIVMDVRFDAALLGDHARPHRARIVLEDAEGKRLHLPNRTIAAAPSETDGWITLEGRPSLDLPMPLGLTEEGFDPARVVAVGFGFEPSVREGKTLEGRIAIRGLRIEVFDAVVPRVLAPDPDLLASEAERRTRMNGRLDARLGRGEELAVGVNLPHPGVPSPEGDILQLYATFLDAPEPWHGEHYDLRNPKVERALRDDFRKIRALFGPKAIVRVFLFNDLRTGIDFDADGTPIRVRDRAKRSFETLLRTAARERVLLIPVLTDFLIADGQDRAGPDGAWTMGEHPDVIVDPKKREAFLALVEELVRSHADHPAVLAWDVMNEPENAVAVVTPEHFAELQTFLREGVEAIHRAGELATIGHRNPVDAARFMRGRVATDLGQAHYYPRVEARTPSYDLSTSLEPAFGALPFGWGEAPVRQGRVRDDLREARESGARYLLYWSYRGDDPSADGFAVRAHRDEISRALRRR